MSGKQSSQPMPPPSVQAPPVQFAAFPPPPCRAEYHLPAPFSQVNGQKYHNLTQAYGQARRVCNQ